MSRPNSRRPHASYHLGSLFLEGEGVPRDVILARRLFQQAPSFMAMLRGPEHVFEMVNPAYQHLIADRDVLVETYQAQLNATYALPWDAPTTVKVGGKINEELRESANRISFWQYNYVGPGGGPTGSFAAFPSPAT